jgi:hypothetical protein
MQHQIKKVFLFVLLAIFLTACTASAPALPTEMIVSMTSYSDVDTDIVQLCADQPKGLYWHEQAQIWAVICKMEYEDMYGAVLMDISYTIISTDHVNAKSMSDLQKMVFSAGWQER